jgi:hypothetical protein
MRVTSKLAKAERTRQDSFVRYASKRGRMSKVTGILSSIRPHSSALTTPAEAESVNHLIWQQNQKKANRQATFEMSEYGSFRPQLTSCLH